MIYLTDVIDYVLALDIDDQYFSEAISTQACRINPDEIGLFSID